MRWSGHLRSPPTSSPVQPQRLSFTAPAFVIDWFTLRCLALTILLVGTGLIGVGEPVPTSAASLTIDATPKSVASFTPAPNWVRDYTPAQFRQLAVATQPIDPDDFHEPLLSAAIFQATNQQRRDLKLPAFLPDEKASSAARLHAQWMARTHTLSHDETSDQESPTAALRRLVRQGLRPHATAENIADNFLLDLVPGKSFYARLENGRQVYSYQPGGPSLRAYTYDGFARTILSQWMRSPRHRAHIVDPGLRFLGVGAALARRPDHPDRIYATQDFYTPHSPAPATEPGST